MRIRTPAIAMTLFSTLAAAGCAGVGASAPPATAPVRPIDARRTYSGVWWVYAQSASARRAVCALSRIEFLGAADGDVFERDVCQDRSGRTRTADGRLTIENPGLDSRYMVRSRVMEAFYVPHTYVILDHGGQYRWMIRQARPDGEVAVFTRAAEPPTDTVAHIEAALKGLGLDPSKLVRTPSKDLPQTSK